MGWIRTITASMLRSVQIHSLSDIFEATRTSPPRTRDSTGENLFTKRLIVHHPAYTYQPNILFRSNVSNTQHALFPHLYL